MSRYRETLLSDGEIGRGDRETRLNDGESSCVVRQPSGSAGERQAPFFN